MPVKAKINERDLQLAQSIKQIRKSKGFTQEKLAERLGISLTHYSYLEIGYKIPNLHMLQKIADILGLQVKDIVPY